MNYGYARVSDVGQDHAGQLAELEAAGCERIFAEKRSAAAGRNRPALRQVVAVLQPGDVVIFTRLDRLARSARDALNVLAEISTRGAAFKSLRETWADTTTPAGRLMVTIWAGLAEFERELILERTREGRQAAKARGVRLGRPATLNGRQRAFVVDQLDANLSSVGELAALLNVSPSTIKRAARTKPSDPARPAAWHAPNCPALGKGRGRTRCICGSLAPKGGAQVDLEEITGSGGGDVA